MVWLLFAAGSLMAALFINRALDKKILARAISAEVDRVITAREIERLFRNHLTKT